MKKIIIGVLLLGIIGGAVGYYMFNKQHDDTADVTAVFTGSSDAIVQEFLDDETASATKYVDQVIEVSGPVMEVTKTNGTVTGVKISSDEFFVVNCTLQEPMESIDAAEVTIKGVCSGFLGDSESMLPGGTLELKRGVIIATPAS